MKICLQTVLLSHKCRAMFSCNMKGKRIGRTGIYLSLLLWIEGDKVKVTCCNFKSSQSRFDFHAKCLPGFHRQTLSPPSSASRLLIKVPRHPAGSKAGKRELALVNSLTKISPHWCTTHSHECQAAPLLSLHLHGFQEGLRLYSSIVPPFPFCSITVQYHYAWDNPRPLAPPFSFKKSPVLPCNCSCFTACSKWEGVGVRGARMSFSWCNCKIMMKPYGGLWRCGLQRRETGRRRGWGSYTAA